MQCEQYIGRRLFTAMTFDVFLIADMNHFKSFVASTGINIIHNESHLKKKQVVATS